MREIIGKKKPHIKIIKKILTMYHEKNNLYIISIKKIIVHITMSNKGTMKMALLQDGKTNMSRFLMMEKKKKCYC
jgi:hypothetical protein